MTTAATLDPAALRRMLNAALATAVAIAVLVLAFAVIGAAQDRAAAPSAGAAAGDQTTAS